MPTFTLSSFSIIIIVVVAFSFALVIALVSLMATRKLSLKLHTSLGLIKSLHSMLEAELAKVNDLKESMAGYQERVESEIQKQQGLIASSSQSIGNQANQLSLLQEQLNNLQAQCDELALQEPAAKIYSKAQTLVKSGASVEEVMEACDLPRAEVEVMVGFQQKAKD
ncbi:DUF2802 domain-containing protein [Glaciecola sp. MH2013]|uniref:DUF2802 domain-containing protein n=1 Tax=Glaciecola sp. MH2013 TaxID=2785524 RepID=UPI00189CA266|nr:DUF2802 domain-containing protein [Glaciecola sp. MH2013]MBF7072396.1 DUF2802 domain-containing protein [Glaciecola sp. MH2013]